MKKSDEVTPDLIPEAEFVFSSKIKESQVVLFGIPFDGTTCYRPGARFGPQAIRQELFGIESYSPYQDKDLLDVKIYDAGDSEAIFGNAQKTLNNAAHLIAPIVARGQKSLMLGGEHLVSLPIIQTYIKKYPDLVILQLDAHADLREHFMGEQLSHACVMKRVWDMVGDGRIFQAGIRSGTREEFAFAKAHTHMMCFDLYELETVMKEIGDRPIYLTIDLDVLDASEMPGTGTPEAGGVRFKELLAGLLTIAKGNIVGADIVELAPGLDTSGISTAAACKLVREVILMMV